MGLAFLIFFAVGKIIKAVVKKQRNSKKVNIVNPRGGSINIGL